VDDFNRKKHLKSVHQKRKERTLNKVDKGIKYLIKNDLQINFNSVARASDVSKSTLYKRKEIRNRIEKLRDKQAQVNSPAEVKFNMNNNSKDSVISSLKRKIKKLKKENKKLKNRNEVLEEKLKKGYGEMYKNI